MNDMVDHVQEIKIDDFVNTDDYKNSDYEKWVIRNKDAKNGLLFS